MNRKCYKSVTYQAASLCDYKVHRFTTHAIPPFKTSLFSKPPLLLRGDPRVAVTTEHLAPGNILRDHIDIYPFCNHFADGRVFAIQGVASSMLVTILS
jgi:hypothetical protein